MHRNRYIDGPETANFSTDKFRWAELANDMQDKILGLAGGRVVVYERKCERRLPDELRPPGMPGDPWPLMTQTYCFERPRQDILAGPRDKLTVTFSECVDRTWGGFARAAGSRGVF